MPTVRLFRCCTAVVFTVVAAGFASSSIKSFRSPGTNNISARPAAVMFLDGLRDIGYKPPVTPKSDDDISLLGNLRVPNVGIGTISWSSTSRK